MTITADLLRAVAHELFDVAVASGVLALLALAVGRIPGVDAGARSRCWSAVAIVPLLAFAAAVLQPMAFREAANRAVPAPIAGAVLIDPLDALQLRAGTANAPAFGAPPDAAIVVETPRSRPFPWLALALALWFAVAAIRLAHVFVSVMRAHRVVARSSPAATGSAKLLGVARDAANARVELRVCDVLDMPVAVGLTHRAVIVPVRLASSLPAGELRAVVLHEIAHLQRRDDWVYLLERIACAVLWFDPIPFAAARASANCREVACDARAAQSTGARTCATALWRSASIVCCGKSRGAALALLSGGSLLERVEALLHPAATSARRAIAAGAALALLAMSVSAIVVVRAPAYALSSGLGVTGSMRTRRASFASVKLRDGRVLVAGGMIANHDFTRAAELYDPARGTFEPTGSLSDGRTGLSGTLLADGRVLVAGGWTSHGVTNGTEIYDPATGRFMPGVPMRSSRAGHTVTPLRDGTLLIAGGVVRDDEATASAELYDPRRNTFTSVAPMPQARVAHTATLLVDGRVLIAGGLDGVTALRSTLLYDPAARTFSAGPQMLNRGRSTERRCCRTVRS